jgi:probable phosphoglycerate mutase
MSMPPMILLRHGETIWNVEGRVQGRHDSALTPTGRTQAAAQGRLLRPLLKRFPDAPVLCSPLGRARATATIALRGLGRAIRLDTRLSEVCAGEWEGLLRSDIYADFGETLGVRDEFSLFLSAPGGERFDDLHARCQSFLDDLRGPCVVITHGVTSLMLRGLVCGLSREEMPAQERGQGCLYLLENGTKTVLREEEA